MKLTNNKTASIVVESVTVPAGVFENCLKIEASASLSSAVVEVEQKTVMWLASQVGPVKMVTPDDVVYELASFKIANSTREESIRETIFWKKDGSEMAYIPAGTFTMGDKELFPVRQHYGVSQVVNIHNLEIPCQLAEYSTVTAKIYDVAGKQIRIIELGHVTVGNYVGSSRAIYWDSRTEDGEQVSSLTFIN